MAMAALPSLGAARVWDLERGFGAVPYEASKPATAQAKVAWGVGQRRGFWSVWASANCHRPIVRIVAARRPGVPPASAPSAGGEQLDVRLTPRGCLDLLLSAATGSAHREGAAVNVRSYFLASSVVR